MEKKDGIAIVTMNVPDKLNAISGKMGKNLPLAIDEIAQDDEVRVVILTGAGRGFCSGADVSAMAKPAGGATGAPRGYLPSRRDLPESSR